MRTPAGEACRALDLLLVVAMALNLAALARSKWHVAPGMEITTGRTCCHLAVPTSSGDSWHAMRFHTHSQMNKERPATSRTRQVRFGHCAPGARSGECGCQYHFILITALVHQEANMPRSHQTACGDRAERLVEGSTRNSSDSRRSRPVPRRPSTGTSTCTCTCTCTVRGSQLLMPSSCLGSRLASSLASNCYQRKYARVCKLPCNHRSTCVTLWCHYAHRRRHVRDSQPPSPACRLVGSRTVQQPRGVNTDISYIYRGDATQKSIISGQTDKASR